MRLPKPCLGGCGGLTDGDSYCDECKALHDVEAYGPDWRRLSKAERTKEPWCHCEGCSLHDGLCGSTEDLTLDHTVPFARGGTPAMGTSVMCRPCNTAKRDRG